VSGGAVQGRPGRRRPWVSEVLRGMRLPSRLGVDLGSVVSSPDRKRILVIFSRRYVSDGHNLFTAIFPLPHLQNYVACSSLMVF